MCLLMLSPRYPRWDEGARALLEIKYPTLQITCLLGFFLPGNLICNTPPLMTCACSQILIPSPPFPPPRVHGAYSIDSHNFYCFSAAQRNNGRANSPRSSLGASTIMSTEPLYCTQY